jgi:esterase/lipase superfamily enzyme
VFRFAPFLTILFILSGCVQNVRPLSEQDPALYTSSTVYFATTRNDTGKKNLNTRFGKKRSEIIFGRNTVAIPNNYPKAHTASFIHWNISLKRDPEKHLALINSRVIEQTAFFSQLTQQADQQPDQPVLVFIHGFNTPFERASRIAAKMAYDLNLKTPAVLFSWPSLERPSAYPADEENLVWSQVYIDQFMKRLFSEMPDTRFILLGHSMGNRALTASLISVLDEHPEYSTRIEGVVLAAPDIDSDIFQRDLAPKLIRHELPMTLYASSKDLAMFASNRLHGYPRAGFAGDDLVVIDGIDTIDASHAEAELLGHEYFSQGAHTIMDIYQWLIVGKPANKRPNLVAIEHENGTYWQIQPE